MGIESQTDRVNAEADQDTPVPSYRGLKIAIVIMSVLIVIGLIVVFSTIIYRAVNPAPPPSAQTIAEERGFGIETLNLDKGSKVEQILYEGTDRVLITVENGGSREIIIFDIRRGYEHGRIKLVPGS